MNTNKISLNLICWIITSSFFFSCSTSKVITTTQKSGGQITGTVRIAKQEIPIGKSISDIVQMLQKDIKLYKFIVQEEAQLPKFGYSIEDCNKQLLAATAKLESAVLVNGEYEIKYTFGNISSSGIFHSNNPPLEFLTPYWVQIEMNNEMSYKRKLPGLFPVYLTHCDRSFDCYDFRGEYAEVPR